MKLNTNLHQYKILFYNIEIVLWYSKVSVDTLHQHVSKLCDQNFCYNMQYYYLYYTYEEPQYISILTYNEMIITIKDTQNNSIFNNYTHHTTSNSCRPNQAFNILYKYLSTYFIMFTEQLLLYNILQVFCNSTLYHKYNKNTMIAIMIAHQLTTLTCQQCYSVIGVVLLAVGQCNTDVSKFVDGQMLKRLVQHLLVNPPLSWLT
eukprot:TRINITY_DN10255_c0_g2_i3.p1 TRINITY_DN10255_c0_g2~~TRINITY_DN10255_c0_g2_i3.p1  ORF type:complete len:204 (+),score=-12.67 TRINITY_DN10255_c0_g2_i3:972-1583(+)